MLRFALSAAALAALLAMAPAAFADPQAPSAPDQAYAAAKAMDQAAPPSTPAASSQDGTGPARPATGKDVPVGFGWG
jgi:hypothetical protein